MVGIHYHLDLRRDELYECWAVLVALLAYPKVKDEGVRADFHASLCHLILEQRAADDEEWANTPQRIKPLYAFRAPHVVSRAMKTLERRFRDRMVAARIGIPFLQEMDAGRMPTLPEGVERLSLNEMCKLVLPDSGQSEPENIETRIWRETLPVIHLACAMAVVTDELERAGQGPVSLTALPLAEAIFDRIVRSAQVYAEMFIKSPRLNITHEQLIRITCST